MACLASWSIVQRSDAQLLWHVMRQAEEAVAYLLAKIDQELVTLNEAPLDERSYDGGAHGSAAAYFLRLHAVTLVLAQRVIAVTRLCSSAQHASSSR